MLTLKGYSLLKSLLNDEEIIKIKSDLTLIPKVNFDMGNKKSEEDSKIILYKETDKRNGKDTELGNRMAQWIKNDTSNGAGKDTGKRYEKETGNRTGNDTGKSH